MTENSLNKSVKRRITSLLCAVAAMLAVTACAHFKQDATGEDEMTYKQITQSEAKDYMDTNSDYILLDVRTDEEFAEGHIPGAVCLPNETITAENEAVTATLPEKNATILVYCRSGSRSKQAAQKLANLGYTDIREFGGIITWQYEIEK